MSCTWIFLFHQVVKIHPPKKNTGLTWYKYALNLNNAYLIELLDL
jgi:hypothetical protein